MPTIELTYNIPDTLQVKVILMEPSPGEWQRVGGKLHAPAQPVTEVTAELRYVRHWRKPDLVDRQGNLLLSGCVTRVEYACEHDNKRYTVDIDMDRLPDVLWGDDVTLLARQVTTWEKPVE